MYAFTQQLGGGLSQQGPITTWVHDIFQGKLVNETRCLSVSICMCGRVWVKLPCLQHQTALTTSYTVSFAFLLLLQCETVTSREEVFVDARHLTLLTVQFILSLLQCETVTSREEVFMDLS